MPEKQKQQGLFSNNKDLEEIIKILSSIQALPQTAFTSFKDPKQQGEWDPTTNTVYLNKNNPNDVQTQTHEFSHALQDKMQEYWFALKKKTQEGGKLTADQTRFLEAMDKLQPEQSNLFPGAWKDSAYQDYRTSWREAPAFGVGNMATPDKSKSAALPHYDATMAQEQAILRELYNRKAQEPTTPWWKDPFGFSIK